MDDKCRKTSTLGISCLNGSPSVSTVFQAWLCAPQSAGGWVDTQENPLANQPGIKFGPDAGHAAHPIVPPFGPRFDMPGPMMRTVRDPALSLAAISGVDPVGSVMVEVPLIMDNSALRDTPALVGWRIGFADEYMRAGLRETVEHSTSFRRVFEVLHLAGAQLLPVCAQWPDHALHFTLEAANEIDERVTEHRLDALVSDGQSSAFHASFKTGYPGICVTFVDEVDGSNVAVWFYGARWARDSLSALVRGYHQALHPNDVAEEGGHVPALMGATGRVESSHGREAFALTVRRKWTA